MARRRQAAVTLHFGSHAPNSPYIPNRGGPRSKTESIIVEGARGTLYTAPLLATYKQALIEGQLPKSLETGFKYILDAHGKGKQIIFEQQYATPEQKLRITNLHTEIDRLKSSSFESDLSLELFKEITHKQAEVRCIRDQIITDAIKRSLANGKVEGRFGTAHADIAKMLRSEGVEVETNAIMPLTYADELIQKIERGEKPTADDYKRGYIFRITDSKIKTILFGRPAYTIRNSLDNTAILVENTLLNRLNSEQLQKIANERDVTLLFSLNGISISGKSPREIRREVSDFMERNSPEWREMKKRQLKKKEKLKSPEWQERKKLQMEKKAMLTYPEWREMKKRQLQKKKD
jgi:hypothetical protein